MYGNNDYYIPMDKGKASDSGVTGKSLYMDKDELDAVITVKNGPVVSMETDNCVQAQGVTPKVSDYLRLIDKEDGKTEEDHVYSEIPGSQEASKPVGMVSPVITETRKEERRANMRQLSVLSRQAGIYMKTKTACLLVVFGVVVLLAVLIVMLFRVGVDTEPGVGSKGGQELRYTTVLPVTTSGVLTLKSFDSHWQGKIRADCRFVHMPDIGYACEGVYVRINRTCNDHSVYMKVSRRDYRTILSSNSDLWRVGYSHDCSLGYFRTGPKNKTPQGIWVGQQANCSQTTNDQQFVGVMKDKKILGNFEAVPLSNTECFHSTCCRRCLYTTYCSAINFRSHDNGSCECHMLSYDVFGGGKSPTTQWEGGWHVYIFKTLELLINF